MRKINFWYKWENIPLPLPVFICKTREKFILKDGERFFGYLYITPRDLYLGDIDLKFVDIKFSFRLWFKAQVKEIILWLEKLIS